MSEELKPCPFCGKPFEMLVNRDGSAIYKHDSDDCVMRRDDLTVWVWYNPETLISDLNTRPVEDALRAELSQAREAQRWMPVSERLPDEGELCNVVCYGEVTTGYWIWMESGDPDEHETHRPEYHAWMVACQSRDNFEEAEYDQRPTHWMPLPEPPKEA